MPVGRIEYLHLGPMTFEDFLAALGYPQLAAGLRGYAATDMRQDVLPEVAHDKCMELLRLYSVVGGLPEAIAGYAHDNRTAYAFERVARVQQSVAATYRDDFNKYSHGRLRDRIQLVFDRLPNMVGRKFKYVQVSREHRAAELADALQHLCMARVAGRVHRTAATACRRRPRPVNATSSACTWTLA